MKSDFSAASQLTINIEVVRRIFLHFPIYICLTRRFLLHLIDIICKNYLTHALITGPLQKMYVRFFHTLNMLFYLKLLAATYGILFGRVFCKKLIKFLLFTI